MKNDPRSPASQVDLEAQFAAEQQTVKGLAASYDAYYALQQMRRTLANEESKSPQEAAWLASAKAFDKKVDALMSGDSGFGIANRDLARRLQDLDFGDMRPTESDLASIHQSCGQIRNSAAQFDRLRQQDLPALNQMLSSAHLPEIPAPTSLSVASCEP